MVDACPDVFADPQHPHAATLQAWREFMARDPPDTALTPASAPHWIVRGAPGTGRRFFCRQLIHELYVHAESPVASAVAVAGHRPPTQHISVPVSRELSATILMDAHHVEIDMGLLSMDHGRCATQPEPVALWTHLLRRAQDAFQARGCSTMTVLCTHFERVSDALLRMFSHFLHPFQGDPASSSRGDPMRIHYVIHTDSTCFFPNCLLRSATVISLGRPTRPPTGAAGASAAAHVVLANRIVREMFATAGRSSATDLSAAAMAEKLRIWARQIQLQTTTRDQTLWAILHVWMSHPRVATEPATRSSAWMRATWQLYATSARVETMNVHLERWLAELWLTSLQNVSPSTHVGTVRGRESPAAP